MRRDIDTVTGALHVPGSWKRDIFLSIPAMGSLRRILTLPEAEDSRFLQFDPGFVRRKFYEVARPLGFQSGTTGPRALRVARGIELLETHTPASVVQSFLGLSGQDMLSSMAALGPENTGRKKRVSQDADAAIREDNSFLAIVYNIESGGGKVLISTETVSGCVLHGIVTLSEFMELEVHEGDIVEVQADPCMALIEKGSSPGRPSSVENWLNGRVELLHRDTVEVYVRVRLSEGTHFSICFSTVRLAELDLREGDCVSVGVPASALSVSGI
ncbi:MAG: hypothetical protein K5657_07675 [Desulfovibrio sp.]|nr:hypothetical protein [Desulfovibrio sp.]